MKAAGVSTEKVLGEGHEEGDVGGALFTPELRAEAFFRLRSLAIAYDASEIEAPEADIAFAIRNACAAHRVMAPHLPEIWKLPRVDVAAIERIPVIAAALLHVEGRCTELAEAGERSSEMSDSLIDMRNRFWTLLAAAHGELERVARFLGLDHAIPSIRASGAG